MVTTSQGLKTVFLEEWLAHGPGPFEHIQPYQILREDGTRLPDSFLPLRYQNSQRSRSLICRGRLEDPWPYSHGIRLQGSSFVAFGLGGFYVNLVEPSWEWVHKALRRLSVSSSDRVSYGNTKIGCSIAIVRQDSTRIEFTLWNGPDQRYRITDPALPIIDDDDDYMVDVGDGIDYAYLYQTILKEEAIDMMNALYHRNELPPEDRWEAARF